MFFCYFCLDMFWWIYWVCFVRSRGFRAIFCRGIRRRLNGCICVGICVFWIFWGLFWIFYFLSFVFWFECWLGVVCVNWGRVKWLVSRDVKFFDVDGGGGALELVLCISLYFFVWFVCGFWISVYLCFDCYWFFCFVCDVIIVCGVVVRYVFRRRRIFSESLSIFFWINFFFWKILLFLGYIILFFVFVLVFLFCCILLFDNLYLFAASLIRSRRFRI